MFAFHALSGPLTACRRRRLSDRGRCRGHDSGRGRNAAAAISCHWRELLHLCQPEIRRAVAEAPPPESCPGRAGSFAHEQVLRAFRNWRPEGKATFTGFLVACLHRVKDRADTRGAIRLRHNYLLTPHLLEAARRISYVAVPGSLSAAAADPAAPQIRAGQEASLCRALLQLKPRDLAIFQAWCTGGRWAVAKLLGGGYKNGRQWSVERCSGGPTSLAATCSGRCDCGTFRRTS